jgi:hypothetical protein
VYYVVRGMGQGDWPWAMGNGRRECSTCSEYSTTVHSTTVPQFSQGPCICLRASCACRPGRGARLLSARVANPRKIRVGGHDIRHDIRHPRSPPAAWPVTQYIVCAPCPPSARQEGAWRLIVTQDGSGWTHLLPRGRRPRRSGPKGVRRAKTPRKDCRSIMPRPYGSL